MLTKIIQKLQKQAQKLHLPYMNENFCYDEIRKGDELMKMNNNIPRGLKNFCKSVWIFTGAEISSFLLAGLCEKNSSGKFYDILCSIVYVFWHISFNLPYAWILITLIWCVVIAKKENSKKIFFHPTVVVTNVISLSYIIYCCVFTATI